MKKILIIPALIALVFLGGCESSFLDKEPIIQLEESDIYKDPDRIDNTVNG